MAKNSETFNLKSLNVDDLLAELRRREAGVKSADQELARLTTETPLSKVSTSELTNALREAQKVIYGVDDRVEAFQISDEDVQKNAASVASLIDIADITDNGDGTSTIKTVTFGQAQNLCSGEPFRNQPTSPFCTGFLVGTELIATAGHCVDGNNIGRTRFVFGFRMNPDGTPNVIIPNGDIYRGIAIVAHKLESAGADYAVVKLDRPVTGRHILPLRRTGKISEGESVYVLGHPSGLPLKYAPGAIVRTNSATSFFVANLDTYGGNSGSPVFHEDTNIVEGILVRGETDFVMSGTCRVSNVCPTTGCRGEDVTRATEFEQFVPSTTDVNGGDHDNITKRVSSLEEKVDSILKVVERIEKKSR